MVLDGLSVSNENLWAWSQWSLFESLSIVITHDTYFFNDVYICLDLFALKLRARRV
jgi:hypothetical protein